ncbi:VOC family protein [Kordia sp.]|uniref:VOC family protein n=1 Tax=Kordia sp. TaxID=1965332 RepID=UPI003D6C2DF0
MKKTIPLVFLLSLIAISCTHKKDEKNNLAKIEKLQAANDSLKTMLTPNKTIMKKQIKTFLTFQDNNAENAMNLYVELFNNSKIIKVQRWGKGAPGEEGKIMMAEFELNGSSFMCSDSPPVHDWNFSPAVSNYVECESESEQERLFAKLSENGTVTMPLNNYGFSKKFGWVIDQFGISWQLNLQ